MFLLGNMRASGLRDTGQAYGGTYAALFAGGSIAGVVAHYWNGNLVFQASGCENILWRAVHSIRRSKRRCRSEACGRRRKCAAGAMAPARSRLPCWMRALRAWSKPFCSQGKATWRHEEHTVRSDSAMSEMADQAAFRGRICDNSWAYRCSECHRSQEYWAFSQNSAALPNRRDKRSAMAGDIARRSQNLVDGLTRYAQSLGQVCRPQVIIRHEVFPEHFAGMGGAYCSDFRIWYSHVLSLGDEDLRLCFPLPRPL